MGEGEEEEEKVGGGGGRRGRKTSTEQVYRSHNGVTITTWTLFPYHAEYLITSLP